MKIGIIGAGPSGLVLALALYKRENVHITVFEKSSDNKNIQTFKTSYYHKTINYKDWY